MKNLLGLVALSFALCGCGGGGSDEPDTEASLLTTGFCTADGFSSPAKPDGTYPRCNPCPGATGLACPLQ